MHVVVVGIDLGKNCCSVAGMDASGRVLFRKRVSRSGVVLLVRKHAGCVVAMEACCGAHHLGRVFAEAGHEVRLMSLIVLPMSRRRRTTTAMPRRSRRRQCGRPCGLCHKDPGQSDLQSLHRARERLVAERTALINHLRALLLERGVIIARGGASWRRKRSSLRRYDRLSTRIRHLWEISWTSGHASTSASRPSMQSSSRDAVRRDDASARNRAGIGLNAMLGCTVGDASAFAKGRDMAAWLGLVHVRRRREASRGSSASASAGTDTCERTSCMALGRSCRAWPSAIPIGRWLRALLSVSTRRCCRSARNKLARICWAVLAGGELLRGGGAEVN